MRGIKKLTKKLDLKDKTILDCGSGNGRLLTCYPEAARHIGIDASLQLLIATKEREPDYWLVCGQLEDMPFKDAIADFSISVRVYQHLRAPEKAFSEMVRATRPAGFVGLEIYNKFNLKEVYKQIRMLPWIEKIRTWGLKYDPYYSYRDIKRWCRENFVNPAGYTGVGWGYHFYFLDLFFFRRFAPKFLQKIVYGFSYFTGGIFGTLPFFRVTMEKVCFIGSVQGYQKQRSVAAIVGGRVRKKFDTYQLKKYLPIFEDRNYALVGDDKYHLQRTIAWLQQAQDATADGGVSRGYSLVHSRKSNDAGWQPSYPETTGYIIPTMLDAASMLRDEDLSRRAKLMGNWEVQIMHADGAVHGGNIAVPENKAVFDTGQVMRGLTALYKNTGDEKYLAAAKKSAEWMLKEEHEKQGRWIANNASSVSQETTTYNAYAAAPVAELGIVANDDRYLELARRVGSYTISQQNEHGWFANADFSKNDGTLLHTIAYTIDGLWGIGVTLNDESFMNSAQKALDGVIGKMDEQGSIPGRLNSEWKGTVEWACLTGIAQIGVTAMSVYNKTNDQKYLDAARKMKEFLKTCQNTDERLGGIGAVWGSWPVSGGYGRFEALNWAAKYFADLLYAFIDLEKQEVKQSYEHVRQEH